jgi:hypothetical protein
MLLKQVEEFPQEMLVVGRRMEVGKDTGDIMGLGIGGNMMVEGGGVYF